MAGGLASAPLVSVLVPICNVERFLQHCLDSIERQTLRSLQVICIDDGSTDRSPAILAEYAARDPRFEVITKPNSGYGSSMNLGLSRARGVYVGIVEPDDFAEPTMFERLVKLAERTGADVVKSNYYEHVTGREPSADVLVDNLDGCELDRAFCPRGDQRVLRCPASIWSGLYKREFLVAADVRFLETPGASFQDTAFNLKALMAAGSIALTKEGFIHYRIDNSASSVRSPSKVFYICDEYAEVWRYLRERPELFEAFKDAVPQVQYEGYCWNMGRLSRRFRSEFFERFAAEFRELDGHGLVRRDGFDEGNWEKVRLLLDDPEEYFERSYGIRQPRRCVVVRLNLKLELSSKKGLLGDFLGTCRPDDEVLVIAEGDWDLAAWVDDLRTSDRRLYVAEGCGAMNSEYGFDYVNLRGDSVRFFSLGDEVPASAIVTGPSERPANSVCHKVFTRAFAWFRDAKTR